MGIWKITIEGHGCHDNNNPDIDADIAAKELVEKLKKIGQDITSAKFELATYIDNVNGHQYKNPDFKSLAT